MKRNEILNNIPSEGGIKKFGKNFNNTGLVEFQEMQ